MRFGKLPTSLAHTKEEEKVFSAPVLARCFPINESLLTIPFFTKLKYWNKNVLLQPGNRPFDFETTGLRPCQLSNAELIFEIPTTQPIGASNSTSGQRIVGEPTLVSV